MDANRILEIERDFKAGLTNEAGASLALILAGANHTEVTMLLEKWDAELHPVTSEQKGE